VSVEKDRVEGRLVVDERHLHPGGYVHGGAWTAFADTVAAWGTMRRLVAGLGFTTAELKLNVFAAGREGDVLDAVGEPLHVGSGLRFADRGRKELRGVPGEWGLWEVTG